MFEMSEGLLGSVEIKLEKEDDGPAEYVCPAPPVSADSRKIRSKRLKEAREKLKKKEQNLTKAEKRRLNDVFR